MCALSEKKNITHERHETRSMTLQKGVKRTFRDCAIFPTSFLSVADEHNAAAH